MNESYELSKIRERLGEALNEKGTSLREASIVAGYSKGYVQTIVKGTADPGIERLANICEKNGISLAFVILGFQMAPETQRLVAKFESSPEVRDNILSLMAR